MSADSGVATIIAARRVLIGGTRKSLPSQRGREDEKFSRSFRRPAVIDIIPRLLFGGKKNSETENQKIILIDQNKTK